MAKKTPDQQGYNLTLFSNPVDFRDKTDRVNYHIRKIMNLCQDMIVFEGLPDSMPQRDIRRLLQVNGYMIVLRPEITDGQMRAFYGGLGGEKDVYYMPTIATVANPALKLSGNFRIHEDAVLVMHDPYMQGLMPAIKSYATMMTETEITMLMAVINGRIPSIISADDSRTYDAAVSFVKDVEAGKLSAVLESGCLDGLKTAPYANAAVSGSLYTGTIELIQYLKASLYNDLGVNANYNMKRESLSMTESQMNDDGLLPYVDAVIESIQTGLDEVNRLFGSSITVHKGSAWEIREAEEEMQDEPGPEPEEEEPTDDPDN